LVDRAIARDALRKVKQSVYFYADAYLVVALALNFELVSTTPSSLSERTCFFGGKCAWRPF